MANNIEKRYSYSALENAKYRAQISGDSNSRHIKGTGIVFNQRSKIITEYIAEKQEVRSFFEVISPFALDGIFNNGFDTVLDLNHSFNDILARIASGTLVLTKDDNGVYYEFDAPETARGEDALQMVKRGDYYESSFAFTVGEDKWEYDQTTGLYLRTILKIETLFDMAICTYRGAYDNTDIATTDSQRVMEYNKEDVEVASRKLNELIASNSVDQEVISPKKNFDSDYITRIYLKRNWQRKQEKFL